MLKYRQILSVALPLIVVMLLGQGSLAAAPDQQEAAEKEKTPLSLAEQYREALNAYVLHVDIRTTLQRGPLVEKIFSTAMIHVDPSGRWHMVKENPLQQERWEIYSLGKDQRKLYLRRNRQPFRFANDPQELNRWLEAALRDFRELVKEPLAELMAGEQKKSETIQGIAARCQTWPDQPAGTQQRRLRLCAAESNGVLLQGEFHQEKSEAAGDYPLLTATEASLRVTAVGGAVKFVAEPSVNER